MIETGSVTMQCIGDLVTVAEKLCKSVLMRGNVG